MGREFKHASILHNKVENFKREHVVAEDAT